jgi:hypothetical protein
MYKYFTELRISREPAVIEGLNLNHTRTHTRTHTHTHKVDATTTATSSEQTTHASLTSSVTGDAIHFPDYSCDDASAVVDTCVYDRQPCILTAEQITALDALLPVELKYCHWKLKYKYVISVCVCVCVCE